MDIRITISDAGGIDVEEVDETQPTDRESVEAGGMLPPEDRASEVAAPPPKFRPEESGAAEPREGVSADVPPPEDVSVTAAAPPPAFRGEDRGRNGR